MRATVIPFRPRECANTFAPGDVAQLHDWAMRAAHADFYIQTDPTTSGRQRWIGRADCGDEFVSITKGSPEAPSIARITPQQRRWVLRDHRHRPIGDFSSLRDALEEVCQTIEAGEAASTDGEAADVPKVLSFPVSRGDKKRPG